MSLSFTGLLKNLYSIRNFKYDLDDVLSLSPLNLNLNFYRTLIQFISTYSSLFLLNKILATFIISSSGGFFLDFMSYANHEINMMNFKTFTCIKETNQTKSLATFFRLFDEE